MRKEEEPWIIRVDVPKGELRVCDYCNCDLIDNEANAIEDCFTTDYGLMCRRCIGSIAPIKAYKRGENVYYEDWY